MGQPPSLRSGSVALHVFLAFTRSSCNSGRFQPSVKLGTYPMTASEAIRVALQSLWANKLRSVLTLLGVVIGVAAVIAVVTFVNGINGYFAEKVFNLGADVFLVFKVSPAVTNVDHFLEGEKRKDLTIEDYQAVAEACRHCEFVGA